MAQTIDRVTIAGGGFTTLHKVLNDHAENHGNLCFQLNDLDIFTDNTQHKAIYNTLFIHHQNYNKK